MKDPTLNKTRAGELKDSPSNMASGSMGSEVINILGMNCPSRLFWSELHRSQHFCNENY